MQYEQCKNTKSNSLTKSGELYNRALNSLAGGVNSNVRLSESPHPLFYSEAHGSKMTDVDGNEYIDYMLGGGPMIFGHSPEFILDAVTEASQSGQVFQAQHELEIEAAEAVQTLIPNAELVRFASSGTEVVEAALRLSRAYTKRNKIVKFEGHYHGWSDNVFFNTAAPPASKGPYGSLQTEPMSDGIAHGSGSGLIILPWNDFGAIDTVFESHGSDIAAVITEPIMCNTNCIMPKPGYLNHLRNSCSENGSLLIFDEVITGFRVDPGGAQSLFNIKPDLATYAKAVGGGFPVSMLCGKKEIMSLIGDGSVTHAGTLNANIMSMAATKAAMNRFSDPSIQVNNKININGTLLLEGIKKINSELEAGMLIQGVGSVFAVSFTDGKEVTDYRTHVENTDSERYAEFVALMQERGIRINGRGIWFTSESHSRKDVQITLDAVSNVLETMLK